MSNYTKEIITKDGKEVACYSRIDSDFKCYIQPVYMLEIYPASREITLDRYYNEWLNQQTNNKDE